MSFLETYKHILLEKAPKAARPASLPTAANRPSFFDSEVVFTNEVSILCFPPLLTRSHFLWDQNGATPLENGWLSKRKKLGNMTEW